MPDRRFPRLLRVNELLREVLAEELERLSDSDDRLVMLTITSVQSEPDFRRAKVLLSSLSDEQGEALEENRHRLQKAIGREVRLKRTPQLSFFADPAVSSGLRVEEIIRDFHQHDEP